LFDPLPTAESIFLFSPLSFFFLPFSFFLFSSLSREDRISVVGRNLLPLSPFLLPLSLFSLTPPRGALEEGEKIRRSGSFPFPSPPPFPFFLFSLFFFLFFSPFPLLSEGLLLDRTRNLSPASSARGGVQILPQIPPSLFLLFFFSSLSPPPLFFFHLYEYQSRLRGKKKIECYK